MGLGLLSEGEGLHIDINPKSFFVGGVDVGLSSVVGFFVVVLLLIALLFINSYIKTFKDKPTGFQNFLELMVEQMYNFAHGTIGHLADKAAPYVMTIMLYIFFTTIVELIGIPPATADLSCTVGLGLMSFILTHTVALRELGIKGRLHNLLAPNPMVFPIKVIADFIAPISMGLRLFANMLLGTIIMEMLYSQLYLSIAIPAIVGLYFNLAHPLIQVFVFGLLSLNYIKEAVE